MVDSLLTDLVSWWSLDETSGGRADSHGTNHLTDSTVGSAAGKVGSAASFNNTPGQSLSVANNSTLHATSDGLTIACWVYVTTATGAVFSKDGSGAREFILDFAGNFRWGLFDADTFHPATSGSTPLNQWVHIVCDWEPISQQGHLYVDGTLAATSDALAQNTSGSANFKIGNRDLTDYPFNGLVDEVGFWSRVLTADERTRIYNSGNGLRYTDLVGLASFGSPFIRYTPASTDGLDYGAFGAPFYAEYIEPPPSASISAEATIAAASSVKRSAAANLTSSAAIDGQSSRLRSSSVGISAEATIIAESGVKQSATSNLTSSAAISAECNIKYSSLAAISAEASIDGQSSRLRSSSAVMIAKVEIAAIPTQSIGTSGDLLCAASIAAMGRVIQTRKIIKIDYSDVNKYKKPYPVGTIGGCSSRRGPKGSI